MRKLKTNVNECEKSELSETFEINPFIGRSGSQDSSRQRLVRSESIQNPILTDFWKNMKETGENWRKTHPDENYFKLEERGFMRHLLLEGNYEEAIKHLEESFPEIMEKEKKIIVAINCLKLVEIMKEKKELEAIEFAQNNLANENVKLPVLDQNGNYTEVTPQDFFSLICFLENEKKGKMYLLNQ